MRDLVFDDCVQCFHLLCSQIGIPVLGDNFCVVPELLHQTRNAFTSRPDKVFFELLTSLAFHISSGDSVAALANTATEDHSTPLRILS